MENTGAPEEFGTASAEEVAAELQRAGVLGPDGNSGLELAAVLRNPERRDYRSRTDFRVYGAGRRPVCYLTVGQDLGAYFRQLQSFAEACPDIACKPLFHHRSDKWEYVGSELFEASSLEQQVAAGAKSAGEAVEIRDRVLAALERTRKDSTAADAARELDVFFGAVAASPMIGGVDLVFLRELVFPFIRKGALAGEQSTRWTNGDFIARNVLVDPRGNVRLVDCEQARRTHFFVEDLWRWRAHSKLAPEAREFRGGPGGLPAEAWSEIHYLLRQLILVHEVNGAVLAVGEMPGAIDRILELMRRSDAGLRASMFFTGLLGGAGAADTGPEAQLFWKNSGEFSEERSLRIAFVAGYETKVSFQLRSVSGPLLLRLDPIQGAGVLQISGIRVSAASQSKPLLVFDSRSGWKHLQLGSELLRLADSPALNLLSVGSDPHILLPACDAGGVPTDVTCEVSLRFSTQPGRRA